MVMIFPVGCSFNLPGNDSLLHPDSRATMENDVVPLIQDFEVLSAGALLFTSNMLLISICIQQVK